MVSGSLAARPQRCMARRAAAGNCGSSGASARIWARRSHASPSPEKGARPARMAISLLKIARGSRAIAASSDHLTRCSCWHYGTASRCPRPFAEKNSAPGAMDREFFPLVWEIVPQWCSHPKALNEIPQVRTPLHAARPEPPELRCPPAQAGAARSPPAAADGEPRGDRAGGLDRDCRQEREKAAPPERGLTRGAAPSSPPRLIPAAAVPFFRHCHTLRCA